MNSEEHIEAISSRIMDIKKKSEGMKRKNTSSPYSDYMRNMKDLLGQTVYNKDFKMLTETYNQLISEQKRMA